MAACNIYRNILRKHKPGFIRRSLFGIFVSLTVITVCELIGAGWDIYSFANQKKIAENQAKIEAIIERQNKEKAEDRIMLDARAIIQMTILHSQFERDVLRPDQKQTVCENWEKAEYQLARNDQCEDIINAH